MVFGIARLTPRQTGRHPVEPTIRVTVDLVQVEAVVTDSTGRHVADLHPQDFKVFEDGKPAEDHTLLVCIWDDHNNRTPEKPGAYNTRSKEALSALRNGEPFLPGR